MTQSWVRLGDGLTDMSKTSVSTLRQRLRKLELDVQFGTLESKAKARAEMEKLTAEISQRENEGLTVTVREFHEPPIARGGIQRIPVDPARVAQLNEERPSPVKPEPAGVPLPWPCLICDWNNQAERVRCFQCGQPKGS